MKKIILLLILSINMAAQGGPGSPPNPACSSPNPPPWCPDNPSVPIDNWQLMLLLLTTAGILGFIQIKKMQKNNVERKLD
jgi:hypothetical protein